jgi:hypothetical protein
MPTPRRCPTGSCRRKLISTAASFMLAPPSRAGIGRAEEFLHPSVA